MSRLRGDGEGARQGLPRRAAAREDGDRRGRERRGARRRRDARARLRRLGLPRARTSATRSASAARSSRSSTGEARPGAERARRRSRATTPTSCSAIASADSRCRSIREVIARIVDGSRFDEFKPLYGTDARDRLGAPPRLPGRHPRQQRHPVLGGGAEGRAVHPALQPDRHAAPLPAEHHRLHGRQALRAGRHHQARRAR